jgi:N-acetylglucosamine kinase-like BadF-type ATPase
VQTFLGVDGGGTKTEFVLVDEAGRVLARHQEGSAYYPEIGLDALEVMLTRGIGVTLGQGAIPPAMLTGAFIGLPCYGEDSGLLARLNTVASPVLQFGQYQCGNDMVCAWAGALACHDGINIVAGTGSIAYGELAGHQARAGGWGELFSDEGSAYWIAREGLSLFSRMSDGRLPKGPLYELLRAQFDLSFDLDLCAVIYGSGPTSRSHIARLAPIIAEAARNGDTRVRNLFAAGARELAAMVNAVRARLNAPADRLISVSYSGGMFKLGDLVLEPFISSLYDNGYPYDFLPPKLPPVAGAALYAARTFGSPLAESALTAIKQTYTHDSM